VEGEGLVIDSGSGEVPREEEMLYSGTDPESYITEYTLVYEDKQLWFRMEHVPEELLLRPRKVDVRLPGKGNSNSSGARPVHLIITLIKWIRTSRLSKKNSLSLLRRPYGKHNDTFRI